MERANHVSRKLIAVTPLLLVGGIIAQTVLLVAAILLFIPLLIWPGLLDKPYRTITRAMGRLMARTIIGKKPKSQAGVMATELSFRYATRRPPVPPGSACLIMVRWP